MDFNEVAKQLGKRGGLKTKNTHSADYYRKLQKLSTEAKKRKKDRPIATET
jgi:hypothetical protein